VVLQLARWTGKFSLDLVSTLDTTPLRIHVHAAPAAVTASNQLTGRTALVAGAASGIGRATALLLATQGAYVLTADINQSAVEELAASSTRR
jgi:NADPH:quinone reductase-like Zn-dependent oxidoreductase